MGVFDSINRRTKCSEADYALGETLPPHLSPFIAERRIGDYVPPEEQSLKEGKESVGGESEEEEEEDEALDDEDTSDGESDAEEEVGADDTTANMGVRVGEMEKLDEDHDNKMQEDEEYRLRVMMIKKKHRGLYRSMMRNRKKRTNEAKNMEKKRKEWDEKNGPKVKKVKTGVAA